MLSLVSALKGRQMSLKFNHF